MNVIKTVTGFILFISIFLSCPLLRAEIKDGKGFTVAVYPFNDLRTRSLNLDIPAVLSSELAAEDFVELMPIEVVRKRIYDIEPSFLWTGKEGDVKEGGIAWRIEPLIVEEVRKRSSDYFINYSVYGDISEFSNRWRVDLFVVKESYFKELKTFSVSGEKGIPLSGRITSLAKDLSTWMKKEYALLRAEEEIRDYKGGLYSHNVAVKIIHTLSGSYPRSIPIHGLLLDLYLESPEAYEQEILKESGTIMEMIEGADKKDLRYLLSLDIDPFDSAARIREKEKNWKRSIDIRDRALQLFPFKKDLHKRKLGESSYFYAVQLEKRGSVREAVDYYGRAISLLDRSSEYLHPATERYNRLVKKTGNERHLR